MRHPSGGAFLAVQQAHVIPRGSDPGTALVHDRGARRSAHQTTATLARRQTGLAPQQTSSDNAPGVARTAMAGPSAARDALSRAPAADRSAWKSQIPSNAMFYDEVGDVTDGIGQPGLLVSVRV